MSCISQQQHTANNKNPGRTNQQGPRYTRKTKLKERELDHETRLLSQFKRQLLPCRPARRMRLQTIASQSPPASLRQEEKDLWTRVNPGCYASPGCHGPPDACPQPRCQRSAAGAHVQPASPTRQGESRPLVKVRSARIGAGEASERRNKASLSS
mmetsp:Transcript_86959/g.156641  ORF Transcript_86959/g.156641 Transcript_86959/m.156641 type:complete len:155 (-) Transcript_86959:254-718(-)